MSNVQLLIGGRHYTVACADGEEEHIVALGQLIDSKLSSQNPAAGQSESRTLLFAALLLADELHECRGAMISQEKLDQTEARLAGQAAALADRVEKIATQLESAASAP
ncbi:cell division protein ZapA [Novosphingobium aquimarinum]|uniref:cell division protein ZapA n=1 Tax=Novosphingobium aquimarinum TaxID=2682494 RepID=UPI0012EB27F2|nr:cell division protein ZapA [Novosphingobium aquimarinum]